TISVRLMNRISSRAGSIRTRTAKHAEYAKRKNGVDLKRRPILCRNQSLAFDSSRFSRGSCISRFPPLLFVAADVRRRRLSVLSEFRLLTSAATGFGPVVDGDFPRSESRFCKSQFCRLPRSLCTP